MSISSIASLGSLPTASKALSTDDTSSTFGMSDFFTLMTKQLQYQDPLEPTDNSQFMAQMAQFSMVEQTQKLAQVSNITAGTSMVGKDVLYTTTDPNSGTSTTSEGVVQAVDFSDSSTPQCYVNNTWVPLTGITRVTAADMVTPNSGTGTESSSATPSSADSSTPS
ncbi:MAG: flagellar hook capping FlgD N-terminal domain-containing protein [Ethanoligenens sp.]